MLPAYGGVTGSAMLHWTGGRWFDGFGDTFAGVTLATGGLRVRPQPGLTICREKLEPGDLTVIDGLRVTTAVRSVCYEMRCAESVREAVTVLDMAAYSDLVSVAELTAYALDHPAWTGIPQCREAIPHADENTWSPAEVDLRWNWSVVAGLPRPLCNRPVFDLRGRHVGTPDVIDPIAGVVGEYDGALHLTGKRRAKDLEREAAFRRAGLEYVTMVGADRANPEPFLQRLRDAYDRARFEDEWTRSWTLEPPPWWTPTLTVEQRRQLDDRQRERLLRYRRAG